RPSAARGRPYRSTQRPRSPPQPTRPPRACARLKRSSEGGVARSERAAVSPNKKRWAGVASLETRPPCQSAVVSLEPSRDLADRPLGPRKKSRRHERTRLSRPFLRADEGIRTLDLLHGKQTL